MKVAIVHELLTMRGGAEKVSKIFADMFPDAPIYTLLYDEKKLGDWFPRSKVRPSRLQKYAGLSTNHHLYLSQFPRAVEEWDFSEFDLVLSASSAFAHGIITNGRPVHLSYVHSPARYLWDRTQDVLQNAPAIARPYLSKVFHRLRIWDSEAAERADHLIAASAEVQRRIELYWRRESTVMHPPIDDTWFEKSQIPNPKSQNYVLVVSTLARYKRIDLVIAAANEAKLPLKIAGEGRDRSRLEKLAGPTAEFLGYCDVEQLKELYTGALCTVFPGEEDFGLVPLESMACGTPVLSYRYGGALETIKDRKTGLFFDQPTTASLLEGVERLRNIEWDPEICSSHASKWSRSQFEESMKKEIDHLMTRSQKNHGALMHSAV